MSSAGEGSRQHQCCRTWYAGCYRYLGGRNLGLAASDIDRCSVDDKPYPTKENALGVDGEVCLEENGRAVYAQKERGGVGRDGGRKDTSFGVCSFHVPTKQHDRSIFNASFSIPS